MKSFYFFVTVAIFFSALTALNIYNRHQELRKCQAASTKLQIELDSALSAYKAQRDSIYLTGFKDGTRHIFQEAE